MLINYCDCIFVSQPPHWISLNDFIGLMSLYKPKSSEYCYHICVTNITLSLEEAGNNFHHFSNS